MTPQELVQFAKRVHDQEGYNLGSGSTREYRNEYWAKVIGYVHWGSTRYNIQPDPRWHLKNGGPGRPQSDDVAVLMPERKAWDFIGGVGANGYQFGLGHEFILPPEQEVYPPPKPQGPQPNPEPSPQPNPQPSVDLGPVTAKLVELESKLNKITILLEGYAPALNDAKTESLNAATRASEIKTQLGSLPQVKSAKYSGFIDLGRFLGGRKPITLEPQQD